MNEQLEARSLLDRHLGLALSAAVVAFAGLRVYYVSGFDTSAALAILSVANRSTILISTFLYLLAAAAPWLVLVKSTRTWLLAGNQDGASFGLQLRTAVIWIPLGTLLISVTTPVLIVGIIAGVIVGTLIRLRHMRREDRAKTEGRAAPSPRWILELPWFQATVAGFLVLGILLSPWQARERLIVGDGDDPIIGYVLGEQANDFLVMEARRELTWVPIDDVKERALCARSKASWFFLPLGTIGKRGGVDCST